MATNKKEDSGTKGKDQETLGGGITQAQLDAWIKQYGQGKVRQIDIDVDGEGKNFVTGWFKKPDMAALAKASPFANDPIQQGMILVNECWLGGDPEIKSDDETLVATILALQSQFKQRVAVVKNY